MKGGGILVINGDAIAIPLADCSVDSVVTDPPYGLSFMGRHWDHGVPGVDFWREAYRVAKPGAYLVAFGGTRTFHRLACGIEDAGWELRDTLGWIYGSGFPKSHDVSKAIDREAGAVRETVRVPAVQCRNPKASGGGKDGMAGATRPWIEAAQANGYHEKASDTPATPEAAKWQGWGTALKPAWEPICLARKPLDGTVANNVLRHGTGGLNIDGCRVGTEGARNNGSKPREDGYQKNDIYGKRKPTERVDYGVGRWPANILHDGNEDATAPFGHAARFFYTAKASRADRDDGVDRNHHPTVKPTALMQWLVRLATPPGGLVLDPFTGSGSTGKAAILEGMRFVGIERENEYAAIATKRVAHAAAKKAEWLC